jgi:hypothetical protein
MTKNMPYSLKNDQENSSLFYQQLGEFTDFILRNLDSELLDSIESYCYFLKINEIETIRSRSEYLVELLMIGIYWNNYSGNAVKTGNRSVKVLQKLYKQRKRFPKHKSEIDKLRGFLMYFFLENHRKSPFERFNQQSFKKLLNWLSATGEFNEEVLRLRNWDAFFLTKDTSYSARLLRKSILFAEQFSLQGIESLGEYMQNLNYFHQNTLSSYKYREDYFFAGRRENEYLLNMFAAEVMNRGLENGFTETKKKVLLLPTCMRNEPAGGCKAKSDGKELVCASCSSECNIGKVASEMKKQGIISYLIPHSSEFSKFLVKWKDYPDTSLIGVACVLNLITGGYEMKRLGISSQCVFLDYCGCKKHWDKDGLATSLNISQLKNIVYKPDVSSKKASLVLTD